MYRPTIAMKIVIVHNTTVIIEDKYVLLTGDGNRD